MKCNITGIAALTAAALALRALPAEAAHLDVLLPLGRTSYQTNELIDVAVVRSNDAPLTAGTLNLVLTGADGGKLSFAFPAAAGGQRATEHLRINGWLLRPQAYTVSATSDGATGQAAIKVYSHIRKSTYKTVHWGGAAGAGMEGEGENGMGFNILMAGDVYNQEASIAGGADVMGNCLMGGGHQHGLQLSLDWSDPNVYIGAMQGGIDRAFGFRMMPNAIGAHLHDEPGLTWGTHPHTKEFSPHDIKQQREAYVRAYGEEPIWYDQTDTKDPAQYEKWQKINDFKLGFMDAFWKASRDDISRLKPGFVSVTQTQYGWSALYDGYYFNVARSLPIISGHGGYDDYWLYNFNPSMYLEMSFPRQTDKPNWYLPEWGENPADNFRMEHNLCFMTGIQGMSAPPQVNVKSKSAPVITEVNQQFQKLGTIFTRPAQTQQDVALLFSKSNQYYKKAQGQPNLAPIFVAAKLAQYPTTTILDEDIIDGSLAAYHKACVLTGITHLDEPIIAGLADFVKGGGIVLETPDCTVNIPGAVRLAADPQSDIDKRIAAANALPDAAAKAAAMAKINSFRSWLDLCAPLAKQLKTELVKAGIRAPFTSSVDTIAPGKQVRGEIEYDFAVNFTCAEMAGNGLGIPSKTSATITVPDDRPAYDALVGGLLPFKKTAAGAAATLDFGPGQMYAIARTARPIGGVQVGAPTIDRDFTRETDPLRVELDATLVDNAGKLLAGTAPMQVKLTDPTGTVRFNIYRAAEKGVLNLALPLAVNDPAGTWTVTVTELLNNTSGTSTFTYKPATQVGAAAGAERRAMYFGPDKDNVYRFFRDHRNIFIVAGTSDYDQAAATRLATIMKPYNVNATIVPLAEAQKPRVITDEQALTWSSGTSFGHLDENARKSPSAVGFNLPGPTVLIGSVADNPLIAFMQTKKVFPYTPNADFPGAGHGMVAWNVLTLGHDIESIALIGNDAAGVNEAVGTAFQFGTSIDPVTPLVFPVTSNLSPAPMKMAAM